MKTVFFVIVIFLVVVVGVFGGYEYHKKLVSRDMRDLAYYKAKYLSKAGWSQGFGSYQLRSLDGGLNWYAVDIDMDSGSVTVKGTVEEVFPGLLAHLDGWKKLIEYTTKNGPITFSGERAAEDISVLRGAGFTVETE